MNKHNKFNINFSFNNTSNIKNEEYPIRLVFSLHKEDEEFNKQIINYYKSQETKDMVFLGHDYYSSTSSYLIEIGFKSKEDFIKFSKEIIDKNNIRQPKDRTFKWMGIRDSDIRKNGYSTKNLTRELNRHLNENSRSR